jgi:hypothetical protein
MAGKTLHKKLKVILMEVDILHVQLYNLYQSCMEILYFFTLFFGILITFLM